MRERMKNRLKPRKLCRAALLLLCTVSLALTVCASGPDLLPEDTPVMEQARDLSPDTVSADAAILTDGTGTVLFEKNADERLPMASTTKIMTALVVLRSWEDPDSPLTVPKEAIGIEGSSVYLYEGETLSVRDLLYALLMESANDAAVALAVGTSGTVEAFVEKMNETAAELGLSDTQFKNPHGLACEGHYTTAHDLASLTAAALENKTFREIVSTYKKEIPLRETEGVRLLVNHNKLLKSIPGCIGVKTGYTTDAGRCLVSAAERDGETLICVTLSAPDDWNDHTEMLEWGFSRYETLTLSEIGEQYAVLPVVGGETEDPDGSASVAVKNTEALSVLVLRGGGEVTKKTELPRFLYAPVEAGTPVGRTVYYRDGKKLGEVTLYTCGDVALYQKPTLWQRILGWFHRK